MVTDDNMLPMSGLAVAHAVAALRGERPVILTTGNLTNVRGACALGAGVSARVNKDRTVWERAARALPVLAQAAR